MAILDGSNVNLKSEEEEEEDSESEWLLRGLTVCILNVCMLTVCALVCDWRCVCCSVVGSDSGEATGSPVSDGVCPTLGVSGGNKGNRGFSSLIRVSAMACTCLCVSSRVGNSDNQRSEQEKKTSG